MGLTLQEFRAKLRIDLKDSGALWSDAELNRAIERAVDDLSRFMPLEQVYETTIAYEVTDESFTTPATTSATSIVNAFSIATKVDGDVATLASKQLDVPRPVKVTLTDADTSITSLTIIVKGVDRDDNYVEESFYLYDLIAAAKTGEIYFKRVTEVEIDNIVGNGANDVLSVGTGVHTGVWVKLANKPIKPETETITNAAGTTTYTRDTDYLMDYINGRVAVISGGSMAAGTAYLADYDKSRLGVNIASLIPVLTRIIHVEYPVDKIPQQFANYSIWNEFLYIGSKLVGESQEQMSEDEHLAIYYEQAHTPPSEHTPGSFAAYLDQVVAIGGAAYALMIEALQYEQQSATDLASARTALGLLAAIHTLAATALAKVTTHMTEADAALDKVTTHVAEMDTALDQVAVYVPDMNTALDAAIVQLAAGVTRLGLINDAAMPNLTDANTALDAQGASATLAAAALNAVTTYLAGATESTKALLAQIATDAAQLRTAIATANNAANAALDGISFTDVATYLSDAAQALSKVITYLEANSAEDAKGWLTKITTDIANLRTAIETALDKATTYLTDATTPPSAHDYLVDGDDKINTVNLGAAVAAQYANYARAAMEIYNGLVAETQARLVNLRTYIEQSTGWTAIASGFVAEASDHISMAAQVVNRERGKIDQANSYLAEAQSRINNLRVYIEQAAGYAGIADGFVAEARERVSVCQAYIAEASQRLAIADRFLADSAERVRVADGYISEANGRFNMCQAFISEASGRFNMVQAFVGEASGRRDMAQAFLSEADGRMAEMDRYIAEAQRYEALAATDLITADRFRTEANERRNEFHSILRDKSEFRRRLVSVPLKQPA